MKQFLLFSLWFALCQTSMSYGKSKLIPWNTWIQVHDKSFDKRYHITDNDIILWQNSEYSLTLNDSADIDGLKAQLRQKPSFVVNLAYNSEATRLIETLQETELFIPPTPKKNGLALFTPSSPLQLTNIASIVHAQDGFSCGNIQILTGLPRLTSDNPNIAPILQNYMENSQARSMMAEVSEDNIQATVTALSSLPTRGHTTQIGIQDTPELIKKTFADAGGNISNLEVAILPLSSGRSEQPNVVASLPGTEDNDTTVIIGAHMDTILGHNPNGNAPGADDDASGIATLVEVLRILAKNQITFKRRVELQAYSAEEVGLIGSNDLATTYAEQSRKVAGMLQIDMDSFSRSDAESTIYLISTSTTPELTASIKSYLHVYLAGDYKEFPLTAGTSDHKVWHDNAYPAAFIFEHPTQYNKALHTINDTIETAHRYDLTSRFVKVSLAFLAHYAGINQGMSSDLASDKNLKVALLPSAATSGSWDLAVSASTAIQSVEFCESTSSTDKACLAYPLPLKYSHMESGRRFFINPAAEPLGISSGVELTLWGYDQNKKVVSVRHIALKGK